MFRKLISLPVLRLSSPRTLTRVNSLRSVSLLKPHVHIKIASSLLHTQTPLRSATSPATAPISSEEVVEPARFDSILCLEDNTQKALKRIFKYDTMSSVQEAVLTRLPNQDDMFVKAKTGTGKTLAFLVAALETAIKDSNPKHYEGASILVISPTRELANQIAQEAQKLCSFYPYKVHCFVGGDSKRRQISNIERQRCDIVVATPGRLNDMLKSVPRFKKMCQNLKVLVLDEADQLLDMGFKRELQDILSEIPEKRQTMLFSATVSPEIRKNLGDFALSPNYELIDTVGENDVNTHMHVKQSAVVAPFQEQFALIRQHLDTKAKDDKVIVFLPTTKATMLYADLFKRFLPNRNIFELHSKKAQDVRSRIAERFRRADKGAILFTSDVSARGVDYPGVSLVMQIGVPSTREQYVHRLGRTGRAGNEGEGLIYLAPFEKSFLTSEIKDLPVQVVTNEVVDTELQTEMEGQLTNHIKYMDEDMVRDVYTAFLGYYSGRMATLGLRRNAAIQEANSFLDALGVEEKPYLSPRFLTQLGMDDKSGYNKKSFGNDRRGGYSNDRRGGYSNDRRGGFGDDRRGGYSNDRRERSGGDRFGGDKRESFGERRGSFNDDRRGGFEKRSFERRGSFNNDRKSGFKKEWK
ncbi:unnamed protein product [Rhizopus stolonifer]